MEANHTMTDDTPAEAMDAFEGRELRDENGYSLGILETANHTNGRHRFRMAGGDTASRSHSNLQIKIRTHDGLAFRTPEGDY